MAFKIKKKLKSSEDTEEFHLTLSPAYAWDSIPRDSHTDSKLKRERLEWDNIVNKLDGSYRIEEIQLIRS